MKTFFSILVVLIITTTSFAQTKTSVDSLNQTYATGKYRLFPTRDEWTFIKLDTSTGHIWQIRFDINGSNRYEFFINRLALATEEEQGVERFTLYPTQNLYNFLLLDQVNGKFGKSNGH